MHNKKIKPHYIAIAGIMGSGKTTAAKILRKELGFPLLEEKPQENPFLEDFYKDMKRWVLHNQLVFELMKLRQNIRAKTILKRTSVIHDGPLEQNKIYLKANRKFGTISQSEYKLIERLLHLYKPHIIQPDLLIFLDAPIELILQRVASRARIYEQQVPRDYIAALLAFQKQWIARHPRSKKLIIPMDKFNLKEKRHRDAFMKLIRRAL